MRLHHSLVLAWALLAAPASAQGPDARAQGAELTADFYQQRIDALWQRMSPPMQAALKSRDALAAFRQQVGEQLGAETAVVGETIGSERGLTVYRRHARFEKVAMPILVQWAIGENGTVEGFFIRPDQGAAQPPAPSQYLDYQPRTRLRLPFADEFHVFWGGRSVEQNYHAAHRNQRFALDLLIVREGVSHTGDGRRNEDYHCFGRPILAPAAGTVIEVVDGIADNPPGQMNPEPLTGNRVIIDHGHNEYSLLAHLRSGSVRVAQGARVEAGDRLGDCGNSGNSSEPHLHYQLQDGPTLEASAGLPAKFSDYLADEQPVALGEPVRGQRIRPNPQP